MPASDISADFLRYESGNEAKKRQPIVPPTVIASEGTSINQSI